MAKESKLGTALKDFLTAIIDREIEILIKHGIITQEDYEKKLEEINNEQRNNYGDDNSGAERIRITCETINQVDK